MINTYIKQSFINPTLKQHLHLRLKPINKLEGVKIFTLPTKIRDRDINAMLSGLLRLVKEKTAQEQSEKYIRLKLQYAKLKHLYNQLKFNCKH